MDANEERAQLIVEMLDKIKPFPENASEEHSEQIDTDRHMLAMRAGWITMPLDQLRGVASGHTSR